MTGFLYALAKSLLLPPGLFVLLLLLAFLLRRLSFVILTLVTLYLFSTPYVSSHLIGLLETYPALTEVQISSAKAEAIVVLGGGRHPSAPEYGGDTVSEASLTRARYAAHLHRKTGLRLIATSGSVFEEEKIPEAALIKQVLENEFRTGPVLTEDKSRNTRENAQFTAQLLQREGIRRIFLVTHANHMQRAAMEFKRAGVDVIPAPTHFSAGMEIQPRYLQWFPGSGALTRSRSFLHEFMGQAWYSLKTRWHGFQGSPGAQPTPH
ncbi:MAG: YdcF family protein [Gammaproteobacteria bacterium]|nr:YdcF family protein [Gammaproteobacteria bacterium]MBU1653293.1 YdcF family protein [Gammaproteobacteria bacterium]MBU1961519.1 YdcF family protein [Gammaproteobacteria bacterium]